MACARLPRPSVPTNWSRSPAPRSCCAGYRSSSGVLGAVLLIDVFRPGLDPDVRQHSARLRRGSAVDRRVLPAGIRRPRCTDPGNAAHLPISPRWGFGSAVRNADQHPDGVFLARTGVVPSLIAVAALTILTSWWYSRKVLITPSSVTTLRSTGSRCSLEARLRLHGEWPDDDGQRLRRSDYHTPQGRF